MRENADVPVRQYTQILACVVALFVVQAAFAEGAVMRVAQVALAGTALVLRVLFRQASPT